LSKFQHGFTRALLDAKTFPYLGMYVSITYNLLYSLGAKKQQGYCWVINQKGAVCGCFVSTLLAQLLTVYFCYIFGTSSSSPI